MKTQHWKFWLGVGLLLLTTVMYLLHYVIFRDAHHILLYLLGDLAFLPIQVLLVGLIVDGLLSERERNARLEKLNMVIGAFYSEVGTRLLSYFRGADPAANHLCEVLSIGENWSGRVYEDTERRLHSHEYAINIDRVNLAELRAFLLARRGFLLALLQNPTLLEHESFTNLLRAVFHLTEELEYRSDVHHLPPSDLDHLAGDMQRAYAFAAQRWMDYLRYLQASYPYLFSLAVRMNPFDSEASPIVRDEQAPFDHPQPLEVTRAQVGRIA